MENSKKPGEHFTDITLLSKQRQKYIAAEIGKTYGKLTVESFTHFEYVKSSAWPQTNLYFNCACSCGNHTVARISNLKNGHTCSCGCERKEKTDIVGRRFGLWTVLERDYSRPETLFYLCRCDCGTVRSVAKQRLIAQRSRSCGGCDMFGKGKPRPIQIE